MPYPNGGATYDEVKRGRKMRWWYESLADWMLANPNHKLKDLAAAFNKRQSTISIILKTDAFRAYYEKRRAEYNATLHERIISKQHDVVEASLDAMLLAIQKKQDQVPLNLLNDIAKTGLEVMGYGAKAAPAVQVNVNNPTSIVPVPVSISDLEEARMAIRQVERQRLNAPPVIENEPASAETVGVPESAAPEAKE